jgi:hypothetical protein
MDARAVRGSIETAPAAARIRRVDRRRASHRGRTAADASWRGLRHFSAPLEPFVHTLGGFPLMPGDVRAPASLLDRTNHPNQIEVH